MGDQISSTPARTTAGRARWWSSRGRHGLALALGEALLETLPVTVWLQTVAAVVAHDPGEAALPFWDVLAFVIAWRLLGRALRGPGRRAVLVALLPFLAICGAVAARVSPAAYGGVPGGPLDLAWLTTLGNDLLSGSPRVEYLFGLLALTGYLAWRGLRLGFDPSTLDVLRVRFALSVAVVVAAVAAAAVVRGPGQGVLAGRLAVLLPLEIFVGLVTLALARMSDAAGDNAGWTSEAGQRPWLSLALALSGIILGVALALSLVVSYDNLIAALERLGPVGQALAAGLQWLIYGFAYLLNFIFSGFFDFVNGLLSRNSRRISPPPPSPPILCSNGKTSAPQSACPAQHLPPAIGIAVSVLLVALILALLIGLAYFIYRALRLVRSHTRTEDEFEERESLDGRALLGAQLRGLLGGLRRRGPTGGEEALPAGSARRLYREVLRMAAALGLGRQPAETPDEYARRLAGTTDAVGAEEASDLAALTAAYDQARYGESEPEGERQRAVHAQGERLVAQLRERTRRT
jgi:hypothetical protein